MKFNHYQTFNNRLKSCTDQLPWLVTIKIWSRYV